MSYTRSSTKGGWGKSKSSKSASRSQKAGLQLPVGLRRMKKMMRKQTLIPTTTSRASLPAVGRLLLYIINKKSRNALSWASGGFQQWRSGAKRRHRAIRRRRIWNVKRWGERRRSAPWARWQSPSRPSRASSPNQLGGCWASPLGGDSELPSLSISLRRSSCWRMDLDLALLLETKLDGIGLDWIRSE